ncbi:MAG: hypothetical protein GX171_03185 [Clostridiales bacterium]|jgi:NRPS condensation-like uncharacterized protein|nr:hypothetical protein [Clostridiales bacterium]
MKTSAKGQVPAWLRLDNAAKIYPAARTKGWMPMFRVSLTFVMDIDRDKMDQALKTTLKRLPLFGYRLRRGLFWYYFERQDSQPMVEEDARNPMLPFRLTGRHSFMLRLRCHKRRVALEVFHALTDGFGATTFLLTLAAEYLFLVTGHRIPPGGMVLDTRDKPSQEEWTDSFPRYARKLTHPRKEQTAWQLKGYKEAPGFLRVVTGELPTQQLLDLARSRGTTVNTLLSALLLQALLEQKDSSRRGRKKPVKLSLPVNLRRFYPSLTLRNFSFYVNVPAHSGHGLEDLDAMIKYISHYMGLETMEARLNARFSANVKAEQNPLLKVAPLFIKSLFLKLMYRATGERYVTSTMTNLGQVNLPPEMLPHVLRMNLVLGPAQKTPLSAAVISACGKTCVSFSKTMRDTGVERAFFTALVKLGIPVYITSN